MKKILLFLTICFLAASCKKQNEWLDVKSNKADVVPASLQDFQALLDNDRVMNESYPVLGLISSDNYYVTYANWQSRATAQERNTYLWLPDIYEGESGFDWLYAYQQVNQANTVLDGLKDFKSSASQQSSYNTIMSSALFYRSMAFYNLLQEFAPPYSAVSATTDPGIPLKLTSDVNEKPARASVQATIDRIVSDLSAAEPLLPTIPLYKTRPSKSAVYALLAKLYLYMGDYIQAEANAAKSLSIYGTLIDFNTINSAVTFPFPNFTSGHPEILFYSKAGSFGILSNSRMLVDNSLYLLYTQNDLRRTLFFQSKPTGIGFRGYYTGRNSSIFSGIATNELYMIRAECLARQGKLTDALTALNGLLQKRWKTGTFQPVTAASADEALEKILIERRKELPFTGILRWEDLRRLNKVPGFEKILTRNLNGQGYTLPANDKRYTFPIPDDEIRLNGIQQNPR